MNGFIGKTLLILCLLAGIGGSTVKAQIDSDTTVDADIPHAFVVRETTLPAGRYTIKVLDDTNLNRLEIRSATGHRAVVFETVDVQADKTPRQSELVFDKIGDQYFLSQIWLSTSNSGAQVVKSKLQQNLETTGAKAERHSVAAQHKLPKTKKAKSTNKGE